MADAPPTSPRSAPPRRRAAIESAVLALVVAGAALAVLLALSPDSNGAAASGSNVAGTAPGLRWTLHNTPAPAVRLPDQDGRTTSLAALRGRAVVLTFLDSRCTNLCPIEGSQLAAVQRRAAAAGRRPELVVVSVNPADTRASVARFVRQAGWRQPWRWLLGSRSTLAPVWRAYHIGVRLRHGQAVQTGKTTIRVAGDVVHTIALYVIDPKGRERYGYLPPFRPAAVAAAVTSVS
jgi:cytochrome oxidase Cu insertion factor (SCO1/SenC/PrrC family)